MGLIYHIHPQHANTDSESGTVVIGSPEYYRGCKRPSNKGSATIKHIIPSNDALTNCDDNVRKRNVARVLFNERMVEPTCLKVMTMERQPVSLNK